jgi:TPR repeat protein
MLFAVGAYETLSRTREPQDLLDKVAKLQRQSTLVRGMVYFFRKDYIKAMECFEASEHFYAKSMRARMLYLGEGFGIQYKEAFRVWYSVKDSGSPIVQTWIGWCYETGNGIEKNEKEAVKWYQAAEKQGNSWAQSLLAMCYSQGKGVTQDVKEALRLYLAACQQGNSFAMWCYGWCLLHGKGGVKDEKEGMKWIVLGAQHGSTFAKDYLNKIKHPF